MSPWLASRLYRMVGTVAKRLPYWPDLDARCPAHGQRFCDRCHMNPSTCIDGDGPCGYYAATGMHWDTCPNRER